MLADQLMTSMPVLDNEHLWEQTNVEFTDWASAANIVVRDLRPLLDQLSGDWWYIRKYPHWRLRYHASDDTDRSSRAQLRAALDDLARSDVLRAWHSAIYEPEIRAFGGPAGMQVAHDLFCRDSRTTLDLLTRTADPGSPLGTSS
ncbi:hypothetical protein BJF78_26160 [Pseudonocardia sp. CNS-139]|nr:hypothetical protein BJF78_26160 [Pseudonocardia sp. CNS-139]